MPDDFNNNNNSALLDWLAGGDCMVRIMNVACTCNFSYILRRRSSGECVFVISIYISGIRKGLL